MKRLVLLSLVMLCLISATAKSADYSGGDGTAGNPYQINDANDMNEIGAEPNDWDDHFVLTADISMSGFEYTTALIAPDANNFTVGFQGIAFTGVFDGNEHKITNLIIDTADVNNDFLGLFGLIDSNGVVKNLGLEDSNVTGGDDSIYIGGLVGYNHYGTISNCVSFVSVKGNDFLGGLVGLSIGGAISNCSASGTINGNDYLGGLVGDNSGSISNCYAMGSVSGNDKVGGLVGQNSGTVTNCYSAAEILGKMYWTDSGAAKIQRANLDGTGVEDLITSGLSGPVDIALDTVAGKIYWPDYGTPSKIKRANLDGTNIEDLVISGLSAPWGIALDIAAGKMYWTDRGTDKIQRADLDGSNVEDLVISGLSLPVGIALDIGGGKMYWTDKGMDKIQRANLDGTGVEDLVTSGLSSPEGIALNIGGGEMYWLDAGTDKIQRADLDGNNVEDLVISGLSLPWGIALDIGSGEMYWLDAGTGKIQRADLDGSNVEDLVISGLSSPHGIALALVTNGGGLVGSDTGGSYTACFWDSDINADVNGIGNGNDPNVIAKSTAEMQTESTFTDAGWDFLGETDNGAEDIWRLCEDGAGYPRLWWEFLSGDFVCPDGVETNDLGVLCEQWLLPVLSADIAGSEGDGFVDFLDWAVFANAWQSTSEPPSANWNPKCDIAPESGDGIVNIDDLAVFVSQWLQFSAYCADIAPSPDGDGIVNMLDFAAFAEHWLAGIE